MNNSTETLESKGNLTAFFISTFFVSLPIYFLAAFIPQEMTILTGLSQTLAPITSGVILAYRENGHMTLRNF
jgi:hypothetical protein